MRVASDWASGLDCIACTSPDPLPLRVARSFGLLVGVLNEAEEVEGEGHPGGVSSKSLRLSELSILAESGEEEGRGGLRQRDLRMSAITVTVFPIPGSSHSSPPLTSCSSAPGVSAAHDSTPPASTLHKKRCPLSVAKRSNCGLGTKPGCSSRCSIHSNARRWCRYNVSVSPGTARRAASRRGRQRVASAVRWLLPTQSRMGTRTSSGREWKGRRRAGRGPWMREAGMVLSALLCKNRTRTNWLLVVALLPPFVASLGLLLTMKASTSAMLQGDACSS
mmetsp:Transcript_55125/g.112755  ORF Transcript_55125/g.112755 Transcript_55125/m.112755 type:complete len:278 (-) Transcript_55125:1384-2217(-)